MKASFGNSSCNCWCNLILSFPACYSFIAALVVSTVAGIVSRFTGRQALVRQGPRAVFAMVTCLIVLKIILSRLLQGDTFTGLYALVPGIYVTKSFFAGAFQGKIVEDSSTFLQTLILKAVIVGVGSVSLWSNLSLTMLYVS